LVIGTKAWIRQSNRIGQLIQIAAVLLLGVEADRAVVVAADAVPEDAGAFRRARRGMTRGENRRSSPRRWQENVVCPLLNVY
jgi:hypothetical protein